MKEYPSIPGPSKAPCEYCYSFLKIDGSSTRIEWSKKQGWYKYGLRHTMLDVAHPVFGRTIPLFLNKYGDDLEKIFKIDKSFRGVQSVIVFCEFFGSKSFAGMHLPDDEYDVVLFDVNPHKKGILGPKEFLDIFGHLQIAELVHQGNFDETLIESVRKETLDLTSKYKVKNQVPEGVVCKGGSGHKLWMSKIKTDRYREELKKRYQANWEKYWGEESV